MNSTFIITTSQLQKIFNFEFKGNDAIIHNLGGIQSKFENLLTFAETKEFLDDAIKKNNIKIIITKEYPIFNSNKTFILSDSPRHLFYQIHSYLIKNNFYGKKNSNSISKTAKIHSTSIIAKNNVIIGNNVTIDPFVCIYENCKIDDGVIIKSHSVLSGSGFQSYLHDNQRISVPHAGWVHIEKNVRIGSNTCIDRGLFFDITNIGKYSQIDNLVHIGHGATIGQNSVIVANSLIGGSCVLGNNVHVAMSATIRDGLIIGSNSKIGMGAVVTKDVDENTTVIGNPAKSIIK